MHSTTKAILIAAVALQASANPLFNRQASSSSTPISSASSNLTTSLFLPTATASSGYPAPTDPTFPFPGGSNSTNGTYYICSFPPINDTAPTSSVPLSTGTVPLTTTVPSVTTTASSSVLTDVFAANATTTPGSATPAITSWVTTASVSVPTPTPTPFTVIGPSATITIECIQISREGHPHPPPPGHGPITSSGSLPLLPTLSAPASSPVSSPLPTSV